MSSRQWFAESSDCASLLSVGVNVRILHPSCILHNMAEGEWSKSQKLLYKL